MQHIAKFILFLPSAQNAKNPVIQMKIYSTGNFLSISSALKAGRSGEGVYSPRMFDP
jgi:hypothetical protein